MTPSAVLPRFPLARALLRVAGLVLVAGCGAAAVLWGKPTMLPALVAAAPCLLGTVASMVLVSAVVPQGLQRVVQLMMVGMGVRLVFAIAGALIMVRACHFDRQPAILACLAPVPRICQGVPAMFPYPSLGAATGFHRCVGGI